MSEKVVNYNLGHFSGRENFNFNYFRGRITYNKRYLVNGIVSYRPTLGISNEIIICPVCKKRIKIRIASEEKIKTVNRFYKFLALFFLFITIYLVIITTFGEWLLIIPTGVTISLLLFVKDYGEPKILKDLKFNFMGHKILT